MSSSDRPFDPPSLSVLPRIGGTQRQEQQQGETETTPPDGPFAIRQVLKKLEKFDRDFEEMKTHCRVAAENSLATAEAVSGIRLEIQAHKQEVDARLSRVELERLWMPRMVATFAIVVATAALILSLLAFQRHS